jgi:hypothetical protein
VTDPAVVVIIVVVNFSSGPSARALDLAGGAMDFTAKLPDHLVWRRRKRNAEKVPRRCGQSHEEAAHGDESAAEKKRGTYASILRRD